MAAESVKYRLRGSLTPLFYSKQRMTRSADVESDLLIIVIGLTAVVAF